MKVLPFLATLLVAGCVSVAPVTTPPAPTPIAQSTPTAQPTAVQTPTPTTAPTAPPTTAPTDAPPESTPPSSTPTPEPTQTAAEPTPASSSGTGSDKIRLADYQYVTMADAEWSETGYREFFAPDAGNVVYAFLMQFEGIDPNGSSYNPLYFTLTVDGTEYSFWPLGKEPELGSGDLGAGETAEGWLSIQAPLAASVELKYEPVFGLAGDTATWTITVNQ
jgi:hypothetical protein